MRRPPTTTPLAEPADNPPPPTPTPASIAVPITTGPDAKDDIIRVNSNLIPVIASVVDAGGRAITDLKRADFELLVDGEVKPISEMSRSDIPVRMAMLFDNSGSLNAAREFEKQAAISFFRRILRPVDKAALYSVASTSTLEQAMTNDVDRLVQVVEGFGKPGGGTALLDGIAEAAEYLRPQEGRRVIVIVSDGTDTVSDIAFDETLRRVQAANCQVYAVRTGHSDSANLRDLRGERRLGDLSAQTGGAVYAPRMAVELDAAFAQIAADLAGQYVLSHYAAEDDGGSVRFHTINLRVPSRAGVRVRARKGYYTPKKGVRR